MNIQQFIDSSSEERKTFKKLKFEKSLASLNDADFQKFCEALGECGNLEELNLKGNEIGKLSPNRFTHLCEAITKCKKIKALYAFRGGAQ